MKRFNVQAINTGACSCNRCPSTGKYTLQSNKENKLSRYNSAKKLHRRQLLKCSILLQVIIDYTETETFLFECLQKRIFFHELSILILNGIAVSG